MSPKPNITGEKIEFGFWGGQFHPFIVERSGAYAGHYSKFDLLGGISAYPGNIYEFGLENLDKVRITTISSADEKPSSDQEYHYCERVPREDKFVCMSREKWGPKASITTSESSAYDCIYFCKNRGYSVNPKHLKRILIFTRSISSAVGWCHGNQVRMLRQPSSRSEGHVSQWRPLDLLQTFLPESDVWNKWRRTIIRGLL